MRTLIARLEALYGFELAVVPAYETAELDELWAIRTTALPSLYAARQRPAAACVRGRHGRAPGRSACFRRPGPGDPEAV